MNKPIDPKKTIHSSNYYAFSFKENIYSEKIDEEAIGRYFSILKNPLLKYKDKPSKELYEYNTTLLGEVNIEEIEHIERWLIDNLDKIKFDEKNKDYIKIFFIYEDVSLTRKSYVREQTRYESCNLFNKNMYNKKINGEIYGLSNNNMGLNSKKPYLANLDRNINEPYLISIPDAIIQKKFFEFLEASVKNKVYKIYFDSKNNKISTDRVSNGYELSLYPEKNEAVIFGYKQYVKEISEIKIKIDEHINEYSGEMDEKAKNRKSERYGVFDNRYKVFSKIDEVFFYNFLIRNLDNLDDVDIRESRLKLNLISYGNIISSWINYNKEKNFKIILDDLFVDSAIYSICQGHNNKAISQLNYYLSLKNYFNPGEGEKYMKLREIMKTKIRSAEEYDFENDDECLFGIGQMIRYILSRNNMGDKNLTFMQRLFQINKSEELLKEIRLLMKKYAHLISVNYNTNESILATRIIQYEFKNSKIDDKWLLAGFLEINYVYNEKKTNEKKIEI